MNGDDDLWRAEWLIETRDVARSMRGDLENIAANVDAKEPWLGLERAWSRIAGQAAYFGESALQAIGIESASLCERVIGLWDRVKPEPSVGAALVQALDILDALISADDSSRSHLKISDEVLARLRSLSPMHEPEDDLRQLHGAVQLFLDQWRRANIDAPPELVARADAMEIINHELSQGRKRGMSIPVVKSEMKAVESAPTIPENWRRGLEQLETVRGQMRDEGLSPKILGRLDEVLRRLGSVARQASTREDETMMRVLCARAGHEHFAIPLDAITGVRPVRRASGDSPVVSLAADRSRIPVWRELVANAEAGDPEVHILLETRNGTVALAVNEAIGEATLWNVGPSPQSDPRRPRRGTDADDREWDILDIEIAALLDSEEPVRIDADRPKPNAAPLLRALRRGNADGGR